MYYLYSENEIKYKEILGPIIDIPELKYYPNIM